MLKIHLPTISYTSVSVKLLQQVNSGDAQQPGAAGKNQLLPGVKNSPSAAASAIMRILLQAEGLKASVTATGDAVGMEVERYDLGEGWEDRKATQVRASGSGNLGVSVSSSNEDYISVGSADGDDVIQVLGSRIMGVSGAKGDDNIIVFARSASRSDINFDHSVWAVDGGEGNDTIAVLSRGSVDLTHGGDGDDKLVIVSQGDVHRTSGGAGRDQVAITTTGSIWSVEGGEGDDAMAIHSTGRSVSNVYGGEGADTIKIAAAGSVYNTYGGEGNDTIAIAARGSATGVHGGAGDDVMNISTDNADRITGGEGNDTIRVTAKWGASANGGDGNDTLQLSGSKVVAVGGKGNDLIKFDSTAGRAARLHVAEGDGHDTVETNAPLSIHRFSDDGARRSNLDVDTATLARNDDGTVTVRFEGSNDSITVKFTGAMAGREIVAKVENGALVIGPANSEA